MSQPPWGVLAPPPVRRDTRPRAVLVIAVLMSLTYGIQALVDLFRPRHRDHSARAFGVLEPALPDGVKATFWCYVVSLGLALTIAIIGAATVNGAADPVLRARRARTVQFVLAAVLLVPFSMYPLWLLWTQIHYAMVCVPSTGFALWVIYRMPRYRRMPARLVLAAFGWGALMGTGFGGSMNIWLGDYYNYYANSNWTNVVKVQHDLASWTVLSAGVFEELGKGAGVAIIYILGRRYFDNVVSGIVVGAAVGLGFNLVESTEYMSPGLASAQQYWFRQSIGLMAAHVAFTAAIGAAFGVARQTPNARQRRLVIACGFGLAAASHFANDVLLQFYGGVKQHWFSPSPSVDILVFQPIVFAVLQGPLVLLYLLLLRAGLKAQRSALEIELAAEARSGSGAVAEDEIEVLLRPERRFYLKMQALFRDGLIGYLTLGRLFAAQLDLGLQRWHRARGEVDEFAPDEQALRERIRRRRVEWEQLRQRQAVPA